MAMTGADHMSNKSRANLHKVDQITVPEINTVMLLMGCAAIMLIFLLIFSFMVEDMDLLIQIL